MHTAARCAATARRAGSACTLTHCAAPAKPPYFVPATSLYFLPCMPCIPASPPRLPSLGARTAPRPPHARWKQISLCLATCLACLSLPHGCPATVSVSLPSCSVFGSRSVHPWISSQLRGERRPGDRWGLAALRAGRMLLAVPTLPNFPTAGAGSGREGPQRSACRGPAGALERPSCSASPPPAAFFSFLGASQPRLNRAARIPGLEAAGQLLAWLSLVSQASSVASHFLKVPGSDWRAGAGRR